MKEIQLIHSSIVQEFEKQISALKEELKETKRRERSNSECSSAKRLELTVEELRRSLHATQLDNKIYRQRLESLESKERMRKDDSKSFNSSNDYSVQEVDVLRHTVKRLQRELDDVKAQTAERDKRLIESHSKTDLALQSALNEIDRLKAILVCIKSNS